MSLPFVSCLCSTYNRFPDHGHLLCEAVESFLRQDYAGPKELIILNDTPGQEIEEPDLPDVCVINQSMRFESLGKKWNALVGWTEYADAILLPWDDDDISLPNRITQAVERLEDRYDHFNPRHVWYMDNAGLHHTHAQGYCHHAAAFTKELFNRVGRYSEDPRHSGANDAHIDPKLMAEGRNAPPLTKNPREWTYIYRWSVSPTHASADTPETGHLKYDWIGSRPIVPGTFALRPHWRQDYVALTKAYLEAHGL